MANTTNLSPMMRQYMSIKENNKDSILMFRLGDFYEMFYDDAKTASKELDLTLTGKDCGQPERAPMCGVPYHSCEGYIARLVAKGYKVAVCEQTQDPATAKGIVSRDVMRIITPGAVIDNEMLDESRNNYLASVSYKNGNIGVCFADISTGEIKVTQIEKASDSDRAVSDELLRFSPREMIINEGDYEAHSNIRESIKHLLKFNVCIRSDEAFEEKFTADIICRNCEVESPKEIGVELNSAAQCALGAAIDYLCENGRQEKISIKSVDFYGSSQYMKLDPTAIRNLELCETLHSKSKQGSLMSVIDRTETAMGKRLLLNWLLSPLLSINEIMLRQNAVEELCNNTYMRCECKGYMDGVRDIERIVTKMVYGNAKAKDMILLSYTAEKFPQIKKIIEPASSKLIRNIYSDIDELEDISGLIKSAINEDAPFSLREGNLIKDGYSSEVDSLRRDMNFGTDNLIEIQNREREKTGIKNLKVSYNKVFGYYIEVTNSFKDKVPEHYIRKQTLVNAERYITQELKDLETRVLTAKERLMKLEYDMFNEIRETVSAAALRFRKTAAAIAMLDVLCSFAEVSAENNYTRPLITNGNEIKITLGRHPVIEQISGVPFVANDTVLDTAQNRCAIITGPNMAGKSTYMRQTALIVIMAQMGMFVPAQSAQIGLVDAVYTRVGASDDLASGRSTFMVEMSEVADILKNATSKSLLILDEIGRGTSTFDGMSIARAVLEFVADKKKLGAKTLFATHYHELTEMENELDGVKNYNIAAKKHGDEITFLRKIVPGGADDSYGIEVASLSGIPKSVIDRAKQILKQTEQQGIVTYKTVESQPTQMSLEMQSATDIMKDLKALDVNTLTPIEAMGILFDISNKAKSI